MLRQAQLKLFIAIALFAFSAIAEKTNFPKIKSDEDILALLVRVQDYIPALFAHQDNVGAHHFEVVEKAIPIIEELEESKEYQQLLKRRGNELSIRISPESGLEGGVTVDSKAIQGLKKQWTGAVSQMKGKGSVVDAINELTDPKNNSVFTGNAQGFTTGLIQTLPGNKRGAVFKMSPDEQLKALSKDLPADVLGAGFRQQNYGLNRDSLSKKEAIELLKAKRAEEAQVDALIGLHTLLEIGGQKVPAMASMPKQADAIDVKAVAANISPETIRNSIEGLRSKLKNPAAKAALERVERQGRSTVKVEPNRAASIPTLTLQEAPPWAGMFRGCAGGDCSTSYSFMYSLSPTDRIFYVKDEGGGVKGYAHGVVANMGGKKTLFVHTIAGPHISGKNVQQILQGLDMAKKEIGVSQIAVDDNSSRINYSAILEAMTQYKGKMTRVELIDAPMRRILDRNADGSYDSVDMHRSGGILKMDKSERLPIEIEVSEVSPEYRKPKVSKGDVLTLAHDFAIANRQDLRKRVLAAGKVKAEDAKAFASTLENRKGLSTAKYLAAVRSMFEKLGLPVTPAYLERKQAYLWEGLVNASDAFDKENFGKTTDRVIRLYESGEKGQEAVSNAVDGHVRELFDSPKYRALIQRQLLDPEKNAQQTLEYLLGDEPLLKARAILSAIAHVDASQYDPSNVAYLLRYHTDIEQEVVEKALKYLEEDAPGGDIKQLRETLEGVYGDEWVKEQFSSKKASNGVIGGKKLEEGDVFTTPQGKKLTVDEILDWGDKVSTYLVSAGKKSRYILRMAHDDDPKSLGKIHEEQTRMDEYEELGIAKPDFVEGSPTMTLLNLGNGMLGNDWLRNQEARAKGTRLLAEFLGKLADQGIYVGHIEPIDMIYTGKDWKLIRSGSINRKSKKAAAEYTEAFGSRWNSELAAVLEKGMRTCNRVTGKLAAK